MRYCVKLIWISCAYTCVLINYKQKQHLKRTKLKYKSFNFFFFFQGANMSSTGSLKTQVNKTPVETGKETISNNH